MVKNLLKLFFPDLCLICDMVLSDNESRICTSCRHDLPVLNDVSNSENIVEKVFYGRVRVENAFALLRFEKKGPVQKLLHKLKYKGHEEVGGFLGDWMGDKLSAHRQLKPVQAVIPVPIHSEKKKKRGYNQVALFGKQIALALDTEYIDDVLIKKKNSSSQVFKLRSKRWEDSHDLFQIQNRYKICGKHILLVDDIITTGATMEACSKVLNQAGDIQISLASMAIAE